MAAIPATASFPTQRCRIRRPSVLATLSQWHTRFSFSARPAPVKKVDNNRTPVHRWLAPGTAPHLFITTLHSFTTTVSMCLPPPLCRRFMFVPASWRHITNIVLPPLRVTIHKIPYRVLCERHKTTSVRHYYTETGCTRVSTLLFIR